MAAMTQNTIVAQTGVWCVAGGFIRTLTRNVARGSCSTVVSSKACSFVLEARWRHMLGVLPSPLWGGVWGGGRAIFRRWRRRHLTVPPPSPPLPHKGGGSRPSVPRVSPLALSVRVERWPIAGSFAISRGAKTEAAVVVAELSDGSHRGRGECVPYARYGETVEGVAAAIEAMAADIARGLDRERLQSAMEPGAARNALDCAFWDLAAKRAARPAHELLGLAAPKPVTTSLTISLATPEAMAQAAAAAAERALLKVKLGAAGDAERIAAVRRAAPRAELIVDANEG